MCVISWCGKIDAIVKNGALRLKESEMRGGPAKQPLNLSLSSHKWQTYYWFGDKRTAGAGRAFLKDKDREG